MKRPFEVENFLAKALSKVGKKHDLLIIDSFLRSKGKRRFNEILFDIPGINPRMLSRRLKEFEKEGLVTKNLVFGTPVVTVYHLTEKAEELSQAIQLLSEWGKKH